MIEFIESSHTYLNDGVIIPSVSELVQYATGEDFSKIPPCVLQKACDYGTSIHKAIEEYYTLGKSVTTTTSTTYSILEFLRLKDEHIKGKPIMEELINYKGLYAGRIDCLSGTTLIDFKTNSKEANDHWVWQLGFYKLALESMGYEINDCYILWLPKKSLGKWIKIEPKSKEECLKVLEDYGNLENN